jgi:NTP pyrophosphatase (non-canonical NTP hydrolase)
MDSLRDIFTHQRRFDIERGWDWSAPRDEPERLRHLQHGTIALTGEVGEFANVLKKAVREHESMGTLPDGPVYTALREELSDVFIYVVKLALALEMDLEAEYYAKMKFNETKFRRYLKPATPG